MSQPPSQRDLDIWGKVRHDLIDWQYTGLTGYFQTAGHRLIDRWARPYVDKIVVEIGCGHGHHLRCGDNSYRHYIGLDIEYKFLCTLRERFSETRVVNGDAYTLPFRDQSVDCVLSIYFLSTYDDYPIAWVKSAGC